MGSHVSCQKPIVLLNTSLPRQGKINVFLYSDVLTGEYVITSVCHWNARLSQNARFLAYQRSTSHYTKFALPIPCWTRTSHNILKPTLSAWLSQTMLLMITGWLLAALLTLTFEPSSAFFFCTHTLKGHLPFDQVWRLYSQRLRSSLKTDRQT